MTDPNALKEEGNQYFKAGNWEDAVSCYTQALKMADVKEAEKAVILKNRAACHLKTGNYNLAVKDTSTSLDLIPNDPKALYRRCQAYEQLGKPEEAYKDAAALLKVDPKNSAVQPILKRLNPIIQEKVKKQNSTTSKVDQMFDIVLKAESDKEQRIQACNNLIVLAREEAGAKCITVMGGVEKLQKMFEDKDPEIIQAAIRTLACLCRGSKERCWVVAEKISLPKIIVMMGVKNEGISTSSAHLLQNIITYISDIEPYKEEVQKYKDTRKRGDPCLYPKYTLDDKQQDFLDQTFYALIKMLQSSKISAIGRDSAMELIIKNMLRSDGVQWTKKFLNTDGIEGLLAIASAISHHETCTLTTTDNSKYHASVALSKIYDDLASDKERDTFRDKCSAFFKDLFGDEFYESKVEAIKAISTLLQGPFEVGNVILGFEGVTQIMLALANSTNSMHQQVAVEAIVYSASKKDRCAGLLNDAVPILKKLFREATDSVKVRALVGLCKLGSYGGSDASQKPMQDGSTLSLAKACRKFLNNPTKDVDLRKWATEGLAFLTLDGDVKEELVNDTDALRSMIDVVSKADKNILYPAVSVFVNLTNSYEKPDIMPEMVELAKYAKQHVPEEHPKDKPDFVKARLKKLSEAGVGHALVPISTTDSKNTRELLSRVFLALLTEEDLRGLIVQQGGAKALLGLALDNNTDTGKVLASQALAKITITANPQTTFPGQRVYEVVRPLLSLLHVDRTALQNFEGLLALTNMASLTESLRKKIVAEKGLPLIEHYQFEEHEMLKRASTECMCNMVMSEEVVKLYEGENDKAKLMLLFCGEEDDLLIRAAAGGLAIITQNEKICRKIIKIESCQEILLSLVVSENTDIQFRGCFIVRNLIALDKEVAETLMQGQMMEVLMAISLLTEPEKQPAKDCAKEALEFAVEHGLIKPQKSDT
ncbi:hypothetical protein FSP39_011661 [Pinctada imbricata]|uniref:UNC-45/Cro1/She4 central domain-containing protein n=1 Tax=Pinctada imbricata TaxID=66713 RepID=A0AA88XP17_PINIB|nr:hypothetical protein FSP39_011661 [Pinctada imbricata]